MTWGWWVLGGMAAWLSLAALVGLVIGRILWLRDRHD